MSKLFDGGISRDFVTRNSDKKNERRNYPTDMYIEVKNIVPHDSGKGYIEGLNENGKNVRVYINAEAFKRNEEMIAAKKAANKLPDEVTFFGHSIDDLMKKYIENKKGKNVVMATGALYHTTKNIDGVQYNIYNANYIENIPSLIKFKRALITCFSIKKDNGYNAVRIFQDWADQAISLSDKDGIEKLAGKIDEAIACEDFSLARMGFQFRTVIKNTREHEYARPFQLVNRSARFDLLKDEEGNHYPVNGEMLIRLAKEYDEYIQNDNDFKAQFPDDTEFFTEVTYYRSLPASQRSKSFNFKDSQTGSPFYQMSRTACGISVGEFEHSISGKIWGGRMYILSSQDKKEEIVDKDGSVIEIKKYSQYVNRAYAGVRLNDIHTFIKTAAVEVPEDAVEYDAFKMASVEVHPDLRPIFNEQRKEIDANNHEQNPSQEEHDVDTEDDVIETETTTQEDSTETVSKAKAKKTEENPVVAQPVDDSDDDIPF